MKPNDRERPESVLTALTEIQYGDGHGSWIIYIFCTSIISWPWPPCIVLPDHCNILHRISCLYFPLADTPQWPRASNTPVVSLVHNMQSQPPNTQGPSSHQPSPGLGVRAAVIPIPFQPPSNPNAPLSLPVPQYDRHPHPSEQSVNVTHTESHRLSCPPRQLAAQVHLVWGPRHFRCPSVTGRCRRRRALLRPGIHFVLFIVTRHYLLTPRIPHVSIFPFPLSLKRSRRQFLLRSKRSMRR